MHSFKLKQVPLQCENRKHGFLLFLLLVIIKAIHLFQIRPVLADSIALNSSAKHFIVQYPIHMYLSLINVSTLFVDVIVAMGIWQLLRGVVASEG